MNKELITWHVFIQFLAEHKFLDEWLESALSLNEGYYTGEYISDNVIREHVWYTESSSQIHHRELIPEWKLIETSLWGKLNA